MSNSKMTIYYDGGIERLPKERETGWEFLAEPEEDIYDGTEGHDIDKLIKGE